MKVAVAKSRFEKKWKNQDVSWDSFVNGLKSPKVTKETMAQYKTYRKGTQDNIKDVGGFVGGELKDGIRKNGYVVCRSMLSLDIDFGTPSTLSDLKEKIDYKAVLYSTHKSTPDNPRYRLIIPLSRTVTEEEYQPIARKVAEEIGIDLFDDSTYQAARLMYLPSVSKDGEYVFYEFVFDKVLDPDKYLKMYDDYLDISTYPVSSRQTALVPHSSKDLEDPLEKQGVIGAFCRAYSIDDVINKFLSHIYKPSHISGRYDYIPADSTAGVMVYDNKFAYSHHATDPAANKLLNAFDLCRIHLYGDLDKDVKPDTPISKHPSYLRMCEMAMRDDEIKKVVTKEREVLAREEFISDDWKDKLQYENRSTILKNTLHNVLLILFNDSRLKGIKYNELSSQIYGFNIPWNEKSKLRQGTPWRDADTAQLTAFLDKEYGTFSERNINIALTKVSDDRHYNPIKLYLESLPAWDGCERVDNLLIKYFNAEDSEYVREVMRKTLVAAVKRLYDPGTKFDTVLILNGPQGIGKSTLFSKLGMEWFSDSLTMNDMRDKVAAEKLQGFWILEIGELAGMKKMDVETIKAFASRQDDKYRPSYGRVVENHPRQCVIVGSTNNDAGFLRDVTGNRRFWPVKVFKSELYSVWDLTKDDIDQIWAEAYKMYKDNEKLTLSPTVEDEAKRQQELALESDDKEGLVKKYLDTLLPDNWEKMDLNERRNYLSDNSIFDEKGTKKRMQVSNIEIWSECYQKDPSMIKNADSYAIGIIINKIGGWEKTGERPILPIYGRQRVYGRKE